ncbi:MAG: T9SS type A sorting domain-containing protein [Carboxylicivirga sp.]|jgi:hypothetical protein|nr:T9SS type A sorting domain-containing protein [Carboxylicivirga sp.]
MKKRITTIVLSVLCLMTTAQTPFLYYDFEGDLTDKARSNDATHMTHGDGSVTPIFSPGKVGNCYEINATAANGTNYLSTPINILNPAEENLEFSIVGWYYIDDSEQTYNGNCALALLKGGTDPNDPRTSGQDRNICLLTRKGDNPYYQYLNTYLTGSNVPSPPSTPTGSESSVFTHNTWHHIAVVASMNATDPATKDIKVYLNGAEIGFEEGATLLNSWGNFDIGFKSGNRNLIHNGKVDEFAIYKTALTSDQLNAIIRGGVSTSTYGDLHLAQKLNVFCRNKQLVLNTTLKGSKKVTVYDIIGKPVYSVTEEGAQIETVKLAKGIYIVVIEAQGKSVSSKAVVQ